MGQADLNVLQSLSVIEHGGCTSNVLLVDNETPFTLVDHIELLKIMIFILFTI